MGDGYYNKMLAFLVVPIPPVQLMRVPTTTESSASISTPSISSSTTTTITNNTTTTTSTVPKVPGSPCPTPTTPQRDSGATLAKTSVGSPSSLQPVVKITPLSSVSVAALSSGTVSMKGTWTLASSTTT